MSHLRYPRPVPQQGLVLQARVSTEPPTTLVFAGVFSPNRCTAGTRKQHAQSARRSRQSGSIMAGQPHRQYTLRDNCRLCGTRMRFQAEPRLLKAPELLVGSVQRRDPEVPIHYKQSTEYNLCIVARQSCRKCCFQKDQSRGASAKTYTRRTYNLTGQTALD